MQATETGRFTIGVFQDVAWATRGLDALKAAGFPREAITILGRESAEVAALIEAQLGTPAERLEVPGLGTALARGALIEALGADFARTGLGANLRRVGFQQHDGRIYEALTARGGVLVAIRSEPAAADALALLHSYGGGNAAIGAWTGRV